MSFNELLFMGLVPGATKATDDKSSAGTCVNLKTAPHETVLLFRFNDLVRGKLGLLDEGEKCCDHLYFVKTKEKTYLLFIELKAGNLGHAQEQIMNAFEKVCGRPSSCKEVVNRSKTIVCALIVSEIGSPSPKDRNEMQSKMSGRGIDLYFGTSRGGKAFEIKEKLPDMFR